MKTELERSLRAMPFTLDDAAIAWVDETFRAMSDDEKLGQLFCQVVRSSDEASLSFMAGELHVGGIMLRAMALEEVLESVRVLQTKAKIPLLISANFEKGGSGAVTEGTTMGSPMEIAATDDDSFAYRLGLVCGREGAAIGANWAFAPLIDIGYNFSNPITGTRIFGSDPDRVRRMGVEYVRGCQSSGVAASIKHFPGDGVDERDQHLVTSVNTMPVEEWDRSYGAAYKASIDAGAYTVMVGHIMLPEYSRLLDPSLSDDRILPASLSPELIGGLLRGKLGFNGLVVSDATTMAGMVIPMPRAQAVPGAIAAGCDMFLFTRNTEEDFGFMRRGIEEGIVTEERLTEAVTKILGLKAALALHTKKAEGKLLPASGEARDVVGCAEHRRWARECADKAITLVKEEPGVLPISPSTYPRVLFYDIDSGPSYYDPSKTKVFDQFAERLCAEGFAVDRFESSQGMEGTVKPYGAVTEVYDLIIYLAKMETKSNQTVVRIEWAQPMGANCPVYIASVPTIFISLENPYHLMDVPRVKTFINAYSSNGAVIDALIEKLMGRSPFTGKNPVDPFCGKWDTRL